MCSGTNHIGLDPASRFGSPNRKEPDQLLASGTGIAKNRIPLLSSGTKTARNRISLLGSETELGSFVIKLWAFNFFMGPLFFQLSAFYPRNSSAFSSWLLASFPALAFLKLKIK